MRWCTEIKAHADVLQPCLLGFLGALQFSPSVNWRGETHTLTFPAHSGRSGTPETAYQLRLLLEKLRIGLQQLAAIVLKPQSVVRIRRAKIQGMEQVHRSTEGGVNIDGHAIGPDDELFVLHARDNGEVFSLFRFLSLRSRHEHA